MKFVPNLFLNYFVSIVILMVSIGVSYKATFLNNEIHKINDHSIEKLESFSNISSINLIIAHPDDELMFFSPLLNVISSEKNYEEGQLVRVFCLSSGDKDGLGHIRKLELEKSIHTIFNFNDIDENNNKNSLQIIYGDMEDGMDQEWDLDTILQKYMKPIVIDEYPLFVTFDCNGISHHKNHISCYKAVDYYLKTVEKQSHMISLKSPSFIKKFTSILLIPYYILIHKISTNGDILFINTFSDYYKSLENMRINHKSQMVWFRYFWWVLSSPVFYNAYEYI